MGFLVTFLFAWMLSLTAFAEKQENLVVPLELGETRLAEIGIYQVKWQSRGKEAVAMPRSWNGESDPKTGIAYHYRPSFLGREALMMHSPWRVPGGATWVEYSLKLPEITPISLSFGIAMEPSAVLPDKGDGVTFVCVLANESGERELLRRHWAKGEWEDHEFDLSAEAGQVITLKLRVEPGPDHNSAWDFSHFGNARVVVGEPGGGVEKERREVVGKMLESKAWQAISGADMGGLANSHEHGVTPSNLLPFHNEIEADGERWRFSYRAEDVEIDYFYQPRIGALDDFTARVDGSEEFQPAVGGGVSADELLNQGRLLRAELRGDELYALWEYPIGEGGEAVKVEWIFGIHGKALKVSARCEEPVLQAFSLGRVGVAQRRFIDVPYLDGTAEFLSRQRVFSCRFLDWTRSNASVCPQFQAFYHQKTDGKRNFLQETGYISISPELAETLPNIPHPPSPWLEDLAPRIVLDVWAHHRGGYSGDREILREIKDHGIDHLAIIQHDWQRYGYDVKLPDHVPANPKYGSEDELSEYGRTAGELGYLWALHENYIDLYPDSPSFDPTAQVLREDGSPSPAWFQAATGIQSYGLKAERALGFARQNSPEAHHRYGTTAAYLDVHTCVPPWHQLDYEATAPQAAMARHKVEQDGELFHYMREVHEGPLLGEGRHHFYWAGLCDGVEAQVDAGEDHVPLLEFDLLKLHPQMVNHGMGYYERWFRTMQETRWGQNAGTIQQLDQYRAREIAYGHAGFIGSALTAEMWAIAREHHLLHPIQRLAGNAKVVEIRYDLGGREVSGGIAWLAGNTERQKIRYESGLTVWVNGGETAWQPKESEHSLPQWGFFAQGPDTEVSTRLFDGKLADYAEWPGFLFVDSRSQLQTSAASTRRDIEPRLKELTYLGGNRVRVSYEWRIGQKPGGDFQCFVHFTHPDADNVEKTAFQRGHALPKPTQEWEVGEVIVDGPHEFEIETDQDWYDLTIGLYQGPRLRLKGPDDGRDRIALARLSWVRENGEIVGIRQDEVPASALPQPPPGVDFSAHTNPVGSWIDFGKVATDGALLIRRDGDQLTVFPYPRGRSFRAALDLGQLMPENEPSKVKVNAIEALTQKDLGEVETEMEDGRLILQFGAENLGRYLIRQP